MLSGVPACLRQGVRRANKSNAVDLFVSGEIAFATDAERKDWESFFEVVPKMLTQQVWLSSL